MFSNRLFWQLFVTAGFAAVFAAGVIYLAVQSQLHAELELRAVRSLEGQIPFAAMVAEAALRDGTSERLSRLVKEVRATDTRVSIIDAEGVVRFDSEHDVARLDNHLNRPEILQAASLGKGQSKRFSQSLNTDLLYFARRIDFEGGVLGYVRLATAQSLIAGEANKLQSQLLLLVCLTLLVVLVTSFVLSRRFYGPINEATRYAQSVASGDYQLRLAGTTKDEIGDLQRALNELARTTEERLERLQMARNELAAILSGLHEGVVALDITQTILHINQAAYGLLNIEGKAIGQRLWEVVRVPRLTSLLEATPGSEIRRDPGLVIGKKTLSVSILSLESTQREHKGNILVFKDVTDRLEIDLIRGDFVANASHELKTPLAAIKGMVETIIDDPGMPRPVMEQFMQRVLSQANRLNQIVLELMQLSRFDRYRDQQVARQDVDLESLMREVYQANKASAEQQGINLRLELEALPAVVAGDREALVQLAVNLVENAIKYSPTGSEVVLRLVVEKLSVKISIKDDGIGIPEAEQERVFERFYRVDPARSRALGGTGLGLSIVRHIAEAHDGTVFLRSVPGKGSEFVVSLPLAHAVNTVGDETSL